MVNPKTIHWYCDGPEPTREAIRYDERVHKRKSIILSYITEMDDAKRKALIKSQATKQKEFGEAKGAKIVTPVKHRSSKGLMKAPSTSQEKPPPLLRDDSKFALEKLSSIISLEDYEDLGNHSTEAMGETGLFVVA